MMFFNMLIEAQRVEWFDVVSFLAENEMRRLTPLSCLYGKYGASISD